MNIPYTLPSITQKEMAYAEDAVKNGWGKNCYAYIQRFEKAFAQFLKVPYAIATSSCTGALTMGLHALGIVPGDEIIVPDITWIASVSPITLMGAVPVFVDIDEKTWCLNPQKVKQAITPKTRAILAVHLYGNVCPMDALLNIAQEHHLFLIEDAAEALGSFYGNKPCGTMGDLGVFSFHGTKTLTTGEGGMLVMQHAKLYEKVLTLSNHGRSTQTRAQFFPIQNGFKFKMANINAAIGLAQLERAEELFLKKRAILHFYKEKLLKHNGLLMNDERKGTTNGAWMPSVVFDKHFNITQAMLLNAFQQKGIDARVFFRPISSLPMYVPQIENKVAYDLPFRAINLPSFHNIQEHEQNAVIQVIENLLAK